MMTVDTETIGLSGLIVLIQYAKDDGPIQLHSPWTETAQSTIDLIEAIFADDILAFNFVFDGFHLYKMWTIWKLLAEIDPNAYPEDHLDLIIDLEERARDYPLCLKPKSVCDIFLHARKTQYQSTMERKNIVIRKVPTKLGYLLVDELEKRIELKEIYFARRKDKNQKKWQIQERKDTFGDIDPDWVNVILRFKASSALKNLAIDALNIPQEEILRFGDISPKLYPIEFGYCPVAKLAMKIKFKDKIKEKKRDKYKYRSTWPDFLKVHIEHWAYNQLARKYATADVDYTRRLYKYFGSPEFNDNDSNLACQVAVARWRGYRIDINGIKELKKKAENKKYVIINQATRLLPTAPNDVKRYLFDVCDETEKLAFTVDYGNTKKITLETVARKWKINCPVCGLEEIQDTIDGNQNNCSRCGGKGVVQHEAAKRAAQILDARKANKEIELYDKLLAAGRFHASLKVIGTLSGRMSGADKLNPTGIKKTIEVKSKFLMAWLNEILCGGDYESQEVTIAEADYKDENLRNDLLTCEKCEGKMTFSQDKLEYKCEKCGSNKGKKIHALFGMFVYPGMSYMDIKNTDGAEDDKYTKCKQAFFSTLYGGNDKTLQKRLDIPLEEAEESYRKFSRHYKGIARAQTRIKNMFESMRQPGGRGTKVEWHEPSETIETMFGFKRYFTLENIICKTLFQLANNLPKEFRLVKMKVVRTDRTQTAGGAVSSAIYSAAFNLQGHNKRAAGNHVIQGTGAECTKRVQRKIWDIQPVGIHPWLVQPMNVHDSVMTPVHPDYVNAVTQTVKETVETLRPAIPLIKMPWETYLGDWGDKGGPICCCETNDHSKIIKAYKNRNHVSKDGLDKKEVHKVMSKQKESYNDHYWRYLLITKELDEIKFCTENDLWFK